MGGGDSTIGSWLSATRQRSRLRNALSLDSCPVREHLGDALHHLGGVVAHSDDRVCSVLGGMLQQQLERIFARLLAEIRQNGDVSADNGLQSRAEISDHAPRAHDNSPHDAIISHHPIARYFQARRNHSCIHSWHFVLLGRTFTCAILTVETPLCEQCSFAILKEAWRHFSTCWRFCRSCLGRTSSGTSCSGSATCGVACTPTRDSTRRVWPFFVPAKASNQAWKTTFCRLRTSFGRITRFSSFWLPIPIPRAASSNGYPSVRE